MSSHTNGNFGPFTYDAFGFGGLDVNNTINNRNITTNRAVPIGTVHNSTKSVGIDALSPQADEILAVKVSFPLYHGLYYPHNFVLHIIMVY